MDPIVVITPTIGRAEELERCLASVSGQDYGGPYEHLVVGDHLDVATAERTQRLCRRFEARFVDDQRPVDTAYQPARIGRLRNLGIDSSRQPLIAHLDDDNTFEPEHLSSLAGLLTDDASLDVAYGWRRVLDRSGRPVPLERYPWVLGHRPEIAREVFEMLAEEGFFEDGSPVIRDRIPDAHGDLFHVDSSEWLMHRRVVEAVRFRERYTPREMIYQYTDDYLFCRDAWRAGMSFGASGRVTLNYYLGGYFGGAGEAV
ncbi:MAG: glycosyltransferase family 2 protein [Acidobacteria bacterium]|nr:glycosyltransferase family 2 protein [Acidobacteriota bacterium]